MAEIFIREAQGSDLPRIEKLMVELIEAMHVQESLDMSMVAENCRTLLNDVDSHILVAEMDGFVIGAINFSIRKTIIHPEASGLIDEFVVVREHRGKGVGKKLINAAVEECRQLGCCEVEVSTEITNTRARKFYKSCGFDEVGVFFEMDILSEK